MWIEIPDENDTYLCNISNAMCRSSLAINALFESMLKGQHIVYASRKLLNTIEKLDYINPSNKAFICWIKQQYIYLYSCRDIVDHKIVVTTVANTISVKENTYVVPLEYFYDFRETKLLTENETDGSFFEDIYFFIKHYKRTSDFFSIKFENDSCHGSNVGIKITQTAKENRIAICLLDSDREMQGATTGGTYKGANKSYKQIKKNHILLLKALEAREKENLFPPSAYMLLCEEKKAFLEVLDQFVEEEKIIKYFDIKDGVKYKKYKINGWEQYYETLVEALTKAGIYKLPKLDEMKEDFVCIEGIGDKVCDIVCQVLLEKARISEEVLDSHGVAEDTKMKVRELRKSVKDILPDYMYREWEQIHNLLFSWGCCIAEKKLPNYQSVRNCFLE